MNAHKTMLLLLAALAAACGDDATSDPGGPDGGTRSDDSSVSTGEGGRAKALDGVWVATRNPNQLLRFAPGKDAPEDVIALEDTPQYVEIIDGVAFYISDTLCSTDFCSALHYHELLTGKTGDIAMAADTYTGSLAFADGALWVADEARDALWRINPASKELVGGLVLGFGEDDQYDSLQVHGRRNKLFVSSFFGSDAVALVDAASQTVLASGGDGDGPTGLAASSDAVWLVSRFDGLLQRLNVETLAHEQSIELESDISSMVRTVAVTGSNVWVATGEGGGAQEIFGQEAKPGLIRVDAQSNSVVSFLALEAPRGLRAHEDALWVMTDDAALQIDTTKHTVARTLQPASGEVRDIVFPLTGGGSGSTQGRAKVDPYSVVEPPPMVCENISIWPVDNTNAAYGKGTASVTTGGTTTNLGAGTCQTLRDESGKVVKYKAVFANGLPDADEQLIVSIDGYAGDRTYPQARASWSTSKSTNSVTGAVTISQSGLHGAATLGSTSFTFDCAADSDVGTSLAVPPPPSRGQALVTDTDSGIVYRFTSVFCRREVVGDYLRVFAPDGFSSGDLYSFELESDAPAEAGSAEGGLLFSFFGEGPSREVNASLTLECAPTIQGTFESEDGRYKGSFNCGAGE